MTLFLVGFVVGALVMFVIGGYVVVAIRDRYILCTPQDVVEAVLDELEVSAYQLDRNASSEEEEEYDQMFAERIAANLVQLTEQKGR